jgi:KH domain
VTDDSAFKKQVRAKMAETGEKYTVARRMVIAGRDPGQPPVALRVYLNPHVDLELTGEAARASAAAGELVRRRIGQAAGVASVSVGGDLDRVRVNIHAARPGVVHGHGGGGADRLRAELEELTGKPVLLAIGDGEAGPREEPGDAGSGRKT